MAGVGGASALTVKLTRLPIDRQCRVGSSKGALSTRRRCEWLSIPFDDRDGWIWLDGEFVPWREAKVHVLTHGLHYASAVFEGERMYEGEIFKLTEHTERLFQSAEILDFEIPFSVAEIDQACKDTCARNGLTDAYVRPIAWRGSEMISVSAPETKIHVAIAAWDWPSYFDPEIKAKGIRMTLAPYERPAPDDRARPRPRPRAST